jgi:predicted DNA-binding transcriptional regulator YafY
MRADRLLSIMLLLQVHRRLTSKELSRRLEVSERTIHRDMDALSGVGVPVYAQRGSGGGWVLDEAFRTKPVGLNEAEIRAIFLARPARLMADLGLDAAAGAAFVKLLSALPSQSRQSADDMQQRIHLDAVGWRRSVEAVPCLPILQEAIWSDQKLRLRYLREGREPSDRVVAPLGLVANGSVWYLVASVEGEFRTYRVSRIEEATVVEEPVVRLPHFNLAEYWEASKERYLASLPVYLATLRMDPELNTGLRQFGRPKRIERQEPPGPDGWPIVVMRFDVFDEAVEAILGWGPRVEVLEPLELRERVIELAEGVVEVYR